MRVIFLLDYLLADNGEPLYEKGEVAYLLDEVALDWISKGIVGKNMSNNEPPFGREDWPKVTENDPGLIKKNPGKCFYCKAKIGELHAADCITIMKTVKLRYSIELEKRVPYGWTEEAIAEFHLRSRWCASNAIGDLIAYLNRESTCLCENFGIDFLGVKDPVPVRLDPERINEMVVAKESENPEAAEAARRRVQEFAIKGALGALTDAETEEFKALLASSPAAAAEAETIREGKRDFSIKTFEIPGG